MSASSIAKGLVRRALQNAAMWLEERPHGGFAYHELNAHYRKWMSQVKGLRDSYTWGGLYAAHLAKTLGYSSVSFVEFGVAGGRGILALEKLAPILEEYLQISVEIHGFDTGKGLPKPIDNRDLPNLWSEGYFPMDHAKLLPKLKRTKLHLGLIKDRLPEMLASSPAPIGFISIDLDMYSSTVDALGILDADTSLLLPRVYSYFDDIEGFTFS